ncbi:hypothetical protein [Phenylobacterium sp.]|uniref:hypothetical protein n=1 Tax=Phenylobacterium sp. TaxID=1871053 RepID=UPI0025D37FBD|nr:hypothetical protein [Phenylobacterium sp.]MBX3482529.1 hypothetical protein [Phenylobacterium sp.]MCW5758911.1 hypothetical protein [Phenylobacterium sp.]
MKRTIYIGYDPREAAAYSVAVSSLSRHLSEFIPSHALVLDDVQARGLYRRPTERRDGRLWDVISDAPMSTEHACARFLVKHLAKGGWVLFMDGDVLVRGDLAPLFDQFDPAMALYCVKHRYDPPAVGKMDGQVQTRYARKNWSSVMAINCDHPANRALSLDLINTAPGRDLHRLCWLPDELIGELSPAYNHLVGHNDGALDPLVVHFTEGLPDMPGYEDCAFAEEWRAERRRQAA